MRRRLLRRACRSLLGLYPYDYRLWFAPEMLDSIDEACRDGRGPRELAALARRLPAEWIARAGTDGAVRGRALPDVRRMRPVGVPQQVWFRRSPCSSDMSR